MHQSRNKLLASALVAFATKGEKVRPSAFLLATCCVLLVLGNSAFANCYTVYDRENQIVLRSVKSPLDLSKPLSVVIAERFPGGSVVISADSTACTEIDLQASRSGGKTSNVADLLDAPSAIVTTGFPSVSGVGASNNQAGTDVQVRGYYRKDGSYVPAHTRAAPGRGRK